MNSCKKINNRRRRVSSEELCKYKLNLLKNSCNKAGPFASDDNDAESIKKVNRFMKLLPPKLRITVERIQVALHFGVVSLSPSSSQHVFSFFLSAQMPPVACLRLTIDIGAHYSTIALSELCFLRLSQIIYPFAKDDPMPKLFAQFKFLQYEDGTYTRKERSTSDSVILICRSDLESPVILCHLVTAGSPQWFIGRDLTSKWSQICINDSRIHLPSYNSVQDNLPNIKCATHGYISLNRFLNDSLFPASLSHYIAVLAGDSVTALYKLVDPPL